MTDITSVITNGDGAQPRHFGGSYVRALIDFVQGAAGPEGLAEILSRAGETRAGEVLSDEANWSSYDQFRRLLEAAGRVLGGPHALKLAGVKLLEVSDAPLTYAVQALGSPESLYANAAQAGAAICSIVDFDAHEVGEREWLLSQAFAPEFEPFEEFCALSAGLHQFGAVVFGYPTPEVVEEQCARDGAPRCVFRIRWEDTDETTRRANLLDTNVRGLRGRLEQFEQTVADLISSEDLQSMLVRTFTSARKAVRATICVLALDEAPPGIRRLYFTGLNRPKAEAQARELRVTEAGQVDGRLVVNVASTRRKYGYLAATRPRGTFSPRETSRLQAYAGFVAAALDSATAVEEARRQSATANTLLELSTALAEIGSLEDIAAKLVRAVPQVMGCDHGAMLLPVGDGVHAKVIATYGCPPEVDRLIRNRPFPIPEFWTGEPAFHDRNDPKHAATLTATGTAASLVIPIVIDGEWAGSLVASVEKDPDRIRPGTGTEDRLRGLAAQASTAIRNARLLDQIRHQALHDPLTGLPNRALILDRADVMLAQARRSKLVPATMFIDLDGFKEINDTFGHATGDALLCAVTARLCTTMRKSDTIGRLGGDEFVVLINGTSIDAGPELVAERLLEVLREPFDLAIHPTSPLSITASIGIATGDRSSPGDLLRDADVALYEAKAAGKDCFRVFEPEMQTTVQDQLLLQMDLRTALLEEQFFLVYQPICNLASGDIVGVEALLRWQHPERGEIQPGEFIPLLEQSGFIIDVGRWVLTEACRQGADWHRRGLRIDVAVNVSSRQLDADRLLGDVHGALDRTGFDARSLVLEITETTMMADVAATSARLSALRALGIRIAIDDFGTGYSSLAVLRNFPADTLKIDRAFVADLGDSAESTALIHTLMQLGLALGLETIAEGIEETAQYKQLEDEQCENGQGFLIARPARPADLEQMLRERVRARTG